MNFLKTIGIVSLVLGGIVLLVASYNSISASQLILQPYVLGVAAVVAGFICIKKSREN
ncbi:hypothetical protein PZB74_18835 [Porifericola rhodea]|uniref:hypothetical protein n=1 Tax=Porifericola rhodea TaxID=930972 RepID=UPI002664E9CC|nr:hypothetical protein [Porifericola rhodea]WKN31008.1 hypothetical protein PZB74_18835 [Porifericola rhodea]